MTAQSEFYRRWRLRAGLVLQVYFHTNEALDVEIELDREDALVPSLLSELNKLFRLAVSISAWDQLTDAEILLIGELLNQHLTIYGDKSFEALASESNYNSIKYIILITNSYAHYHRSKGNCCRILSSISLNTIM